MPLVMKIKNQDIYLRDADYTNLSNMAAITKI